MHSGSVDSTNGPLAPTTKVAVQSTAHRYEEQRSSVGEEDGSALGPAVGMSVGLAVGPGVDGAVQFEHVKLHMERHDASSQSPMSIALAQCDWSRTSISPCRHAVGCDESNPVGCCVGISEGDGVGTADGYRLRATLGSELGPREG